MFPRKHLMEAWRCGSLVCPLAGAAAVTKDYKLHTVNDQNGMSHNPGGEKAEIRMPEGRPLEGCEEGLL